MNRTSLIAELSRRGLRDDALAGPLYKRLAQALTSLIQEGLLKPGAALPGERDLAEALKLGRVTVRTAYRDLMAAGALESRHGSGTFVSGKVERMEQSLWRLSSFSADMRSRGRLPAARILSQEVNTPSPEESFLLGLGGDEPVLRLDRLRLADGLPLAIERAVVPVKFLGENAGGEGSLYDALAANGHRPVRALQRLTAVTLDASYAAMLNVKTGAPALLIERVSRLEDQRVVEYTRSHYRGDAYDFVAELRIGDDHE
ncbi:MULTISPECIES: GntR family transcriptional regulator [Rhizobium]|uniref:GntR family transcriptional regulator n=1 Tax=Rhizobium bangladeshense TaxID=1138189 RepID=A0ABS7LPJ7_9HYPH|nr:MULTISPECIES: GntR family transcriptional regulator [Rhizobium]MBX4869108.1 GntR family transcriptional regulator [Rhizobium bangladeshense]MBX4873055.1 GntR family transcriptional regulator [Rhizobium bangladeshense]MBX4884432.1 GntR family transcriptional regulator [Rhizobium bangladeshense]MBX4890623.1 GntR family transcriptional regulator [Rhizobium bangladeshense]MBX4897735.1 GntR family transcriptional regulator [Rhizobium bangladeshense]